MKDKKIWLSIKISSAPEIHVSWLYYGDIKIRDTFVYEYTLVCVCIRKSLILSLDSMIVYFPQYKLLWLLMLSTVLGLVMQRLAARLGTVTGTSASK